MDVRERVAAGLLLDGGLATELERAGADLGDDLWSARVLLEEPARIRAAHAAFFDAGADVAITASYQVSYEGFARRGLDRAATARLLTWSVSLAREAADEAGPDALVAASVGPYGASLADGSEYVGDYGLSATELAEWHRPRPRCSCRPAPTSSRSRPSPRSSRRRRSSRSWPTCPRRARGWRSVAVTARGSATARRSPTPPRSPRRYAQVVAVGVNCTPPGFVPPLLASAAGVGLPLLAYPNVGSTWDATARSWRVEGPRPDLAAASVDWRAAGAMTVGGCCGVTPEDIAAIAAVSA